MHSSNLHEQKKETVNDNYQEGLKNNFISFSEVEILNIIKNVYPKMDTNKLIKILMRRKKYEYLCYSLIETKNIIYISELFGDLNNFRMFLLKEKDIFYNKELYEFYLERLVYLNDMDEASLLRMNLDNNIKRLLEK